MKEDTARDRKS